MCFIVSVSQIRGGWINGTSARMCLRMSVRADVCVQTQVSPTGMCQPQHYLPLNPPHESKGERAVRRKEGHCTLRTTCQNTDINQKSDTNENYRLSVAMVRDGRGWRGGKGMMWWMYGWGAEEQRRWPSQNAVTVTKSGSVDFHQTCRFTTEY